MFINKSCTSIFIIIHVLNGEFSVIHLISMHIPVTYDYTEANKEIINGIFTIQTCFIVVEVH